MERRFYVLLLLLPIVSCASSSPRFTSDLVTGEIEVGVPAGWDLRGNAPQLYVLGLDRAIMAAGTASATLYSTRAHPRSFGTLMQRVHPTVYAGHRVRLRAKVRLAGLDESAALWMRADTASMHGVAFDNMLDRQLKGTADWATHDIVLDIPGNAKTLSFGMLLSGRGQIWVDDVSLEVVSPSVPTTAQHIEAVPIREPRRVTALLETTNLDFEGPMKASSH